MRTVAAEIISVHMLRIIFWYPVLLSPPFLLEACIYQPSSSSQKPAQYTVGNVLVVQTVDVSENVFPRVDADKLVVFIEPVIAERLDKPEIKREIAVQVWKRLCAE